MGKNCLVAEDMKFISNMNETGHFLFFISKKLKIFKYMLVYKTGRWGLQNPYISIFLLQFCN